MLTQGFAKKGLIAGSLCFVLGLIMMVAHLWMLKSAFNSVESTPADQRAIKLAEAIDNSLVLLSAGTIIAAAGLSAVVAFGLFYRQAKNRAKAD